MQPNQSEKTVDVINFNGTFTLYDGLTPYTDYSVYVTVRITDRPQESIRTMTVTGRTLAGGK